MILPIDAEPEWGGTQPVKFPYTLEGLTVPRAGVGPGSSRIFTPVLSSVNGHGEFSRCLRPCLGQQHASPYAADNELITQSRSPYFLGAFSDDTDNLSGFGPGTDFPSDPPARLTSIWATWRW